MPCPRWQTSEALTFQKLSDNGQIMSLDTRFNATDDSRGPELTRTASRPFAPFPAVFPAVSQQRAIQVMAAFAGLTWVAGFLLGEDTSGGAQYDFLNSHWAGSKLFADRPFLPVLRDYPTATMPLQHLLMAQLPWVHDPFAYRLTGFAIGTAALVMFGIAVHHRFALVWRNPNLPLLAAAAVALSPGLRSAAFWGNTDALPLLLMALTVLMLYDGRTGNWRKSASLGLVIVVALTTAAAFYTRQFYAFLAIFCFWLLASRTQFSRPLLCLVFGITAIPALFLVWLWHGLTPPCCQSKPALTNVVYAGALAAPFALPFLFTRPPLGRPSTRAWIGLGAIATALFLIFHGMNLTPLGGGLITKFGLLLGPAGVPVVLACAALGWWAIGMLLASGLDNAILFGLAIFPLLLPDVRFQRYLDPLAFTLVLLLASPPLARRLVTERSIFAGYFFFLGLELIGLTWFMILGHKLL